MIENYKNFPNSFLRADSTKVYPSVEAYYGPYTSKSVAYNRISADLQDNIPIGLRFLVIEGSAATEYYFKTGITFEDIYPTGTSLKEPLLSINNLNSNPTQSNKVLMWSGSSWAYADYSSGGASLNQPLLGINQSGMGTPSTSNQLIFWNGFSWQYGDRVILNNPLSAINAANLGTPQANQVLYYNGNSWTYTTLSSGISLNEPLDSINSQSLGSPSQANQVIYWDGSAWQYGAYSSGGGSTLNQPLISINALNANPTTAEKILYWTGTAWQYADRVTLRTPLYQINNSGLTSPSTNNAIVYDGSSWKYKYPLILNDDSTYGRVHKIINVSQTGAVTSSDFNISSCVYHIQFDAVLTQDVTIPSNCVIQFEGGSLSGEQTLTGTNTIILNGYDKCFGSDITIDGTFLVDEASITWFEGANSSVDCSTQFNSMIRCFSSEGTHPFTLHVPDGTYNTQQPIQLYSGVKLLGASTAGSIINNTATYAQTVINCSSISFPTRQSAVNNAQTAISYNGNTFLSSTQQTEGSYIALFSDLNNSYDFNVTTVQKVLSCVDSSGDYLITLDTPILYHTGTLYFYTLGIENFNYTVNSTISNLTIKAVNQQYSPSIGISGGINCTFENLNIIADIAYKSNVTAYCTFRNITGYLAVGFWNAAELSYNSVYHNISLQLSTTSTMTGTCGFVIDNGTANKVSSIYLDSNSKTHSLCYIGGQYNSYSTYDNLFFSNAQIDLISTYRAFILGAYHTVVKNLTLNNITNGTTSGLSWRTIHPLNDTSSVDSINHNCPSNIRVSFVSKFLNGNLNVYPSTSAPSSYVVGTIYFNTSTKKLQIYDGSAWINAV